MGQRSSVRLMRIREHAETIFYYALAIALAFLVTGVLLHLTGQSAIKGYITILTASFRSPEALSLTIFKFIPLYLMGLGLAIPLASKKFNMGIEGQYLIGAIGATFVGVYLHNLPKPLHVSLVLLASAAFGAAYALIPALLLYFFNVNEIVSGMLLNFISFYIVDIVCVGKLRDVYAGHPMTIPISDTAKIPLLTARPQIHVGSIITLVLGLAAAYIVYRSVFGYELRASGSNPIAASKFGINVALLAPLSLVLGGIVAGLAGGMDVAGFQYRLVEEMQDNYTPLAIIATLMAKSNPIALILTTMFIAVLDIGASAMQRTMGAPIEVVYMTEALMILFIMLAEALRRRRR